METLIELETLAQEIRALALLSCDSERDDALVWLQASRRLTLAVEAIGVQFRALRSEVEQ